MFGRKIVSVVLCLWLLGIAACNLGTDDNRSGPRPGEPGNFPKPLQTRAKVPGGDCTQLPTEPIVISQCQLAVFEKQDVPSQRDGVLKKISVREGDIVDQEDILGQLDDRLAQADFRMKEGKIKAANADKAELDQQLVGEVTLVDSDVTASSRQVRVWAVVSNPKKGEKRLLNPGDPATMVVPPESK